MTPGAVYSGGDGHLWLAIEAGKDAVLAAPVTRDRGVRRWAGDVEIGSMLVAHCSASRLRRPDGIVVMTCAGPILSACAAAVRRSIETRAQIRRWAAVKRTEDELMVDQSDYWSSAASVIK